MLIEASQLGIEIPKQYFDEAEHRFPTLKYQGVAWVTRTLREKRMSIAKDWISIISPILSLIIALLSLIFALLSHHDKPKCPTNLDTPAPYRAVQD